MAIDNLDDALTDIEGSANDLQTRVTTDISALQAEIAELQSQAGQLTPTQTQRLTALKAQLDALDPSNPATLQSAAKKG